MEKFIAWLAVPGHQTQMARSLGIAVAQVNQWRTGRRGVPIAYGARIEAATQGQVTRKDIYHDWQVHWPELAYPSSVQPMRGVGKRSAALLAPKRQAFCTPIEPAGGGIVRHGRTKAAI